MNLKFKQIEPDNTLESLTGLLDSIVMVRTAQYKIVSDFEINLAFFHDQSNYKSFFDQFAREVNQLWGDDWDFAKVPFRPASKEIEALISILRSGGAYSDGHSYSEAQQVEEEFRFRFKGQSSELIILDIVNYEYSDDDTTSYSVNMKELSSLSEISPWFLQVAWDNLIFIINPDSKMMYVIAITDED